MVDLPPPAQAVLDAFENASDGEYVEGVWVVNERTMLAAALRAAADQVVPVELEDKDLDFSNPDDKAEWYQWSQRQCTRHQLLAIADELEAHQ